MTGIDIENEILRDRRKAAVSAARQMKSLLILGGARRYKREEVNFLLAKIEEILS